MSEISTINNQGVQQAGYQQPEYESTTIEDIPQKAAPQQPKDSAQVSENNAPKSTSAPKSAGAESAPAAQSSGSFPADAVDMMADVSGEIDNTLNDLFNTPWYTETADGYWVYNEEVFEMLAVLQDYLMLAQAIAMLMDIWSSAMDMTLQIMFELKSTLEGNASKNAKNKGKKVMEYLNKAFQMMNDAINNHNNAVFNKAMAEADKAEQPNWLLVIVGGILLNGNLSKNELALRKAKAQLPITQRKEEIDLQNAIAVHTFVDLQLHRAESSANDPEGDEFERALSAKEAEILRMMNMDNLVQEAGSGVGGTYYDLNKDLTTAMITALDMISNLRLAYFEAKKKQQEAMKMILEMSLDIKINKKYLDNLASMISDVNNMSRTALFININRINTYINSHNTVTNQAYEVAKNSALLTWNIIVPILGLTDYFVLLGFPDQTPDPAKIDMANVDRQLADWGLNIAPETGVLGDLDRREQELMDQLVASEVTITTTSDEYQGLNYENVARLSVELTKISAARAAYVTVVQMLQEMNNNVAGIILGVELGDTMVAASSAAKSKAEVSSQIAKMKLDTINKTIEEHNRQRKWEVDLDRALQNIVGTVIGAAVAVIAIVIAVVALGAGGAILIPLILGLVSAGLNIGQTISTIMFMNDHMPEEQPYDVNDWFTGSTSMSAGEDGYQDIINGAAYDPNIWITDEDDRDTRMLNPVAVLEANEQMMQCYFKDMTQIMMMGVRKKMLDLYLSSVGGKPSQSMLMTLMFIAATVFKAYSEALNQRFEMLSSNIVAHNQYVDAMRDLQRQYIQLVVEAVTMVLSALGTGYGSDMIGTVSSISGQVITVASSVYDVVNALNDAEGDLGQIEAARQAMDLWIRQQMANLDPDDQYYYVMLAKYNAMLETDFSEMMVSIGHGYYTPNSMVYQEMQTKISLIFDFLDALMEKQQDKNEIASMILGLQIGDNIARNAVNAMRGNAMQMVQGVFSFWQSYSERLNEITDAKRAIAAAVASLVITTIFAIDSIMKSLDSKSHGLFGSDFDKWRNSKNGEVAWAIIQQAISSIIPMLIGEVYNAVFVNIAAELPEAPSGGRGNEGNNGNRNVNTTVALGLGALEATVASEAANLGWSEIYQSKVKQDSRVTEQLASQINGIVSGLVKTGISAQIKHEDRVRREKKAKQQSGLKKILGIVVKVITTILKVLPIPGAALIAFMVDVAYAAATGGVKGALMAVAGQALGAVAGQALGAAGQAVSGGAGQAASQTLTEAAKSLNAAAGKLTELAKEVGTGTQLGQDLLTQAAECSQLATQATDLATQAATEGMTDAVKTGMQDLSNNMTKLTGEITQAVAGIATGVASTAATAIAKEVSTLAAEAGELATAVGDLTKGFLEQAFDSVLKPYQAVTPQNLTAQEIAKMAFEKLMEEAVKEAIGEVVAALKIKGPLAGAINMAAGGIMQLGANTLMANAGVYGNPDDYTAKAIGDEVQKILEQAATKAVVDLLVTKMKIKNEIMASIMTSLTQGTLQQAWTACKTGKIADGAFAQIFADAISAGVSTSVNQLVKNVTKNWDPSFAQAFTSSMSQGLGTLQQSLLNEVFKVSLDANKNGGSIKEYADFEGISKMAVDNVFESKQYIQALKTLAQNVEKADAGNIKISSGEMAPMTKADITKQVSLSDAQLAKYFDIDPSKDRIELKSNAKEMISKEEDPELKLAMVKVMTTAEISRSANWHDPQTNRVNLGQDVIAAAMSNNPEEKAQAMQIISHEMSHAFLDKANVSDVISKNGASITEETLANSMTALLNAATATNESKAAEIASQVIAGTMKGSATAEDRAGAIEHYTPDAKAVAIDNARAGYQEMVHAALTSGSTSPISSNIEANGPAATEAERMDAITNAISPKPADIQEKNMLKHSVELSVKTSSAERDARISNAPSSAMHSTKQNMVALATSLSSKVPAEDKKKAEAVKTAAEAVDTDDSEQVIAVLQDLSQLAQKAQILSEEAKKTGTSVDNSKAQASSDMFKKIRINLDNSVANARSAAENTESRAVAAKVAEAVENDVPVKDIAKMIIDTASPAKTINMTAEAVANNIKAKQADLKQCFNAVSAIMDTAETVQKPAVTNAAEKAIAKISDAMTPANIEPSSLEMPNFNEMQQVIMDGIPVEVMTKNMEKLPVSLESPKQPEAAKVEKENVMTQNAAKTVEDFTRRMIPMVPQAVQAPLAAAAQATLQEAPKSSATVPSAGEMGDTIPADGMDQLMNDPSVQKATNEEKSLLKAVTELKNKALLVETESSKAMDPQQQLKAMQKPLEQVLKMLDAKIPEKNADAKALVKDTKDALETIKKADAPKPEEFAKMLDQVRELAEKTELTGTTKQISDKKRIIDDSLKSASGALDNTAHNVSFKEAAQKAVAKADAGQIAQDIMSKPNAAAKVLRMIPAVLKQDNSTKPEHIDTILKAVQEIRNDNSSDAIVQAAADNVIIQLTKMTEKTPSKSATVGQEVPVEQAADKKTPAPKNMAADIQSQIIKFLAKDPAQAEALIKQIAVVADRQIQSNELDSAKELVSILSKTSELDIPKERSNIVDVSKDALNKIAGQLAEGLTSKKLTPEQAAKIMSEMPAEVIAKSLENIPSSQAIQTLVSLDYAKQPEVIRVAKENEMTQNVARAAEEITRNMMPQMQGQAVQAPLAAAAQATVQETTKSSVTVPSAGEMGESVALDKLFTREELASIQNEFAEIDPRTISAENADLFKIMTGIKNKAASAEEISTKAQDPKQQLQSIQKPLEQALTIIRNKAITTGNETAKQMAESLLETVKSGDFSDPKAAADILNKTGTLIENTDLPKGTKTAIETRLADASKALDNTGDNLKAKNIAERSLQRSAEGTSAEEIAEDLVAKNPVFTKKVVTMIAAVAASATDKTAKEAAAKIITSIGTKSSNSLVKEAVSVSLKNIEPANITAAAVPGTFNHNGIKIQNVNAQEIIDSSINSIADSALETILANGYDAKKAALLLSRLDTDVIASVTNAFPAKDANKIAVELQSVLGAEGYKALEPKLKKNETEDLQIKNTAGENAEKKNKNNDMLASVSKIRPAMDKQEDEKKSKYDLAKVQSDLYNIHNSGTLS